MRTGGRSERVVASVLDAARAELANVGYVALRLEDVASRAGVAKTTIYRRWATKAELVHAALHEAGHYDDPLPDTGSLRKDMLVMLERTMKLISTSHGLAVARMINMERSDPEVDALSRRLKDEARSHRASLVVRAQERGLIPAGVDPILVTDSVFTLVLSRLVRFGERIDRATCERLVDLVVTGAENGGGQRPVAPARPTRGKTRARA